MYHLNEIQFSTRVGNTARYLYLPHDMKCETLCNDEIDVFLKQHNLQRIPRILNEVKAKFHYVLMSIVLFLLFVVSFFMYGVPLLSFELANLTPYSTKEQLSKTVLSQLNNVYLYQSRLSVQRQNEIHHSFTWMLKQLHLNPSQYTLHIKSSNIGANAFALPSGDIVLTDDLINLAANDHEILSVLLHEIGHVEHNHGFQSIYRNSSGFLFSSFLMADISSVTVLGASLPTFFLSNQYSQEFEYEADAYFKNHASKLNLDKYALSNLLQRLSKLEIKGIFSYFSSHPSTQDRIKKIE